jgi:hypothetical protein
MEFLKNLYRWTLLAMVVALFSHCKTTPEREVVVVHDQAPSPHPAHVHHAKPASSSPADFTIVNQGDSGSR